MRGVTFQTLPLTVIALVLLLLFQQTHAQTVAKGDCATGVHAILARGSGQGNDLNVLVKLKQAILEQIPGSTVLGLPYGHGNSDKFEAVYNGALLLQRYIEDYVASCPDTKIALLGYSLGAVTMMDALCGTSSLLLEEVAAINPKYNTSIITAAAYGDETYVPLMPWNTGNCTLGLGIFPRLDPLSCEPFAASLHSYCDYGDDQCCFILPLDDNKAHHEYIEKYDQDVVDFIKKRLAE
ncbi:uncharacterized protein PFLUO_LOCUS5948 [Penicillium psychrofluorescens]|uniref:uncharacterized protein n=1 Tax=Penicillium psychrofluorescens TaxID=3158075 RepID=UPI003CCDF264